MDKRAFLKSAALLGGGLAVSTTGLASAGSQALQQFPDVFTDNKGLYVLPVLPFDSGALEPYIDKQTVEIHHCKHHAGYVKGLNNAVDKVSECVKTGDYTLIKHWEKELAFHGAGHILHTLYWNNLSPRADLRSATLDAYLTKSFGSFEAFQQYFSAATAAVEGGGWGILAYQPGGDRLVVLQAEIHQNLSQWMAIPILVCDVWEHAYYLKYQNKRAEYIAAFFKIVNWQQVDKRLAACLK